MKAILTIPEKEISFEFDNLIINQFKLYSKRPEDYSIFQICAPVSKIITLVTSNMPDSLKKEIEELIKIYCNH